MTGSSSLLQGAVFVMCAAPLTLMAVLATTALLGRRLGEKVVAVLVRTLLFTSFVAATVALVDRLAK